MKKAILIFLFPAFVLAQQSPKIKNLADAIAAAGEKQDIPLTTTAVPQLSSADEISVFYKNSLPELQNAATGLKLVHQKRSLTGDHYTYVQTFNGVPVHNAYIKVNTDLSGNVITAVNHLTAAGNVAGSASAQPGMIYIENGSMLVPAVRTVENGTETFSTADHVPVLSRDARFYFDRDDTVTVSARVFNPDPLSTAGVIYGQGGTYKHFNDSDYALLNDERKDVNMVASFTSGVYVLENPYVVIQDFNSPDVIPVTSLTPDFNFTRKQTGFKDVMAFYHINHVRNYIHSLGFTSLMMYQQRVDAHSGSADNSNFQPGDLTLNFGTGGVPDAEDADVICHEYTHAIGFDINGTSNTDMTNERLALDEGAGDVMAALMSYKSTSFNWRKLFNLDGPNPLTPGNSPFWGGRDGQSEKTYLNKNNNPHKDCEIWTSCLLDIADAIGHDTLMKLMLNSMFSYTGSTTMPDAARLLITSDSMLYGKSHALTMGVRFNGRKFGVFPVGVKELAGLPSWISIANTAGFAEGTADAIINLSGRTIDLRVMDMSGKVLVEQRGAPDGFSLSPSQFGRGMYLLELFDGTQVYKQKLVRF